MHRSNNEKIIDPDFQMFAKGPSSIVGVGDQPAYNDSGSPNLGANITDFKSGIYEDIAASSLRQGGELIVRPANQLVEGAHMAKKSKSKKPAQSVNVQQLRRISEEGKRNISKIPAPVLAEIPKVVLSKKKKQDKEYYETNKPFYENLTKNSKYSGIPDEEEDLPERLDMFHHATKEVVIFNTSVCKIKSKARIIESEYALVLVYDNEDDMSFIPEEGLRFEVSTLGRTIEVFAQNVTFTWFDGQTKIMVLIKAINDDTK